MYRMFMNVVYFYKSQWSIFIWSAITSETRSTCSGYKIKSLPAFCTFLFSYMLLVPLHIRTLFIIYTLDAAAWFPLQTGTKTDKKEENPARQQNPFGDIQIKVVILLLANISIPCSSPSIQNQSDLDFDLSRWVKVKTDVIGVAIYGFLLMVNSNIEPNSATLRDIILWNPSDLDLTFPGHSRSKRHGVLGLAIYAFQLILKSNIGPNLAP